MSIDTPAWVRDAVFYQIFPDRFASSERVVKPGRLEPWDTPPTVHGFKGGDLLGIVEHLAYLQDLGINALYLTPIFQSASNHRYHTYDYFTVDPLLGGNGALRELIDTAHDRGMRVVLDGVFNHTGRGFWPFHHILENGAASPYRRWFHLDESAIEAGRSIRAYPDAGTAAADLGYVAWWGLPALPKLNTDEPEVRAYLFRVAETWLRFGIDGWRLDVPAEIDDEAFWQEFRTRCRAIRPDAYLVGEIWREAPEWLRGDRFDALMNYPLGEAILGYAGGASLDLDVVRSHHEYDAGLRSLDGPGFAARVMALMGAYDRNIVDVQLNLLGSHDAPRMRTVLGGDLAAVRLATLFQATLPGAPCVYYGDEVGLVGGNDPASRGAFPWDRTRWAPGLRETVRALFQLRSSERALRAGPLRVVGAADGAVAFERGTGSSRFVVVANAGENPVDLTVRFEGDGSRGHRATRRDRPSRLRHDPRVGGPRRRGDDPSGRPDRGRPSRQLIAAACRTPFAAAVRTERRSPGTRVQLMPSSGGEYWPRDDASRWHHGLSTLDRLGRVRAPDRRHAELRPSSRIKFVAGPPGDMPHTRGPVADLPIALGGTLNERLARCLDTEEKIPRALDALGPIGGRDVVLIGRVDGIRARQLTGLGARLVVAPEPDPARGSVGQGVESETAGHALAGQAADSADVVVGLWSSFRGAAPEEVAEAERVARQGGRLLVVHDYGRDDVSRLRGALPEYGSWTERTGPFLGNGFKVRVIHCFWTFESMDDAADFLRAAFGRVGDEVAASMTRPRLSYNVAVYHRALGTAAAGTPGATDDPPPKRPRKGFDA